MKRRKIKPPTALSYGLMEYAANSVGISMLSWMPARRQPQAARIAAKLRKPSNGRADG